jgi:hypothetical protein
MEGNSMLEPERTKTRINTTIIVEIQNADEIKLLMDRQREILMELQDNVDAICAARLRLVANARPPAGTDGCTPSSDLE